MKFLLLSSVLLLSACSSRDKGTAVDPAKVSNESFKKQKALSSKEVTDFYSGNSAALSPALQDETLDRHTVEEREPFGGDKDPLAEIAILCSTKKFKEAFELAGREFTRYQKIGMYWNQVANCHLNQGSPRKALLFYNKALEVSPNYVPALNNIGVMYSRQGQDQKALVAFERAYKQSRYSKTPRYNLAKLYLMYGLSEEAMPILTGLLTQSPQDVDLLNAVASSHFLMSDYQRALSYYQQIPQNLWNRAEIGLNIAITLKKTGRAEDAMKVLGGVDKPSSSALKNYYSVVQNQLGGKE